MINWNAYALRVWFIKYEAEEGSRWAGQNVIITGANWRKSSENNRDVDAHSMIIGWSWLTFQQACKMRSSLIQCESAMHSQTLVLATRRAGICEMYSQCHARNAFYPAKHFTFICNPDQTHVKRPVIQLKRESEGGKRLFTEVRPSIISLVLVVMNLIDDFVLCNIRSLECK